MLGGQRGKGAISPSIVLNKYKVPNLNTLSAVSINQLPFSISVGCKIDVQLAARTTRPCFAHHPEVVLFITVYDVHARIKAGSNKYLSPVIVCFLVKLARITFAGLVNGSVQTIFRETPRVSEQFPSPLNGFFFKVITKGPVAEHLEKSMVIRVHTDII